MGNIFFKLVKKMNIYEKDIIFDDRKFYEMIEEDEYELMMNVKEGGLDIIFEERKFDLFLYEFLEEVDEGGVDDEMSFDIIFDIIVEDED